MIKLFPIIWCILSALADENNFQKSLVQVIEDAGYAVEVHKVKTEDNYILTVFRLPSKFKNPKVVFIMHGIESSAADYVIGGKGASLSYLLADNGYDVWMGNARGNVFSQAHKTLNTKSNEFWNFSFHEIGVYDLPAMIDYSLDKSKATSLSYCGYSQGTTAFFVLLSMRPEYNSKLSMAHLMAPVAYFRFPMPVAKVAASMYLDQFADYVHANRLYELLPLSSELRNMAAASCKNKLTGITMCRSYYMLIGGETRTQFNEDLIPKIFKFFPASAGYGQFLHYGQIINNNGRFVQFDHQPRKNEELYGQPDAPPYNLTNVRTSIHFLYGLSDKVANPKDVEFLMAKLKGFTAGITKINDWNHLDFIYGKDIQKKVNNVILQKMKSQFMKN